MPAPWVRVVKKSSKMRGGRPRGRPALVVDREGHVPLVARVTRTVTVGARRAGLHGVADEVPQHLAHLARRRSGRRRRRRGRRSAPATSVPRAAVRREGHHLAGQGRHVGASARGGLGFREVDHVADQIVQAPGLALHDVAETAVLVRKGGGFAQHLEGAGDRPEGIADLVREARGDAPQRGEALGLVGAGRRGLRARRP